MNRIANLKTGIPQILIFMLLAWWFINLLQAGLTGLNEDEAYYWMWSKHLDWGFFDHPPMVALQMALGQIFGSSKAAVRFLTPLMSVGSIFFLWLIIKEYTSDLRLFWWSVLSIPLIHIYGFITTPDVALFFFGTAYFYFLKKYFEKDSLKNSIALAVVIALMFYSKYHAVLLVGFTVLSNFKLLTKGSFWLVAVLSIVLLTPHILWQIENDLPSIRYHLFDRAKRPYQSKHTFGYLLNQWLVLGPLTAYFLLSNAWKTSTQNNFIRALKWNFVGIFIFFFLSSFKGRVEPHWTYVAIIPVLILGIKGLSEKTQIPKLFYQLAGATVVLLFVGRTLLIIPGPWAEAPALKRYYHGEEWAHIIKEKAGDRTVVFRNGFQETSLYGYYSKGAPVFVRTEAAYRKHQYDLWHIEDTLQGRPALCIGNKDFTENQSETNTPWGTVYTYEQEKYSGAGKLNSIILKSKGVYNADALVELEISLTNNFLTSFITDEIPLKLHPVIWYKGDLLDAEQPIQKIETLSLLPGEEIKLTCKVQIPEIPGTYKMMVSVVSNFTEPRHNGSLIDFEVK